MNKRLKTLLIKTKRQVFSEMIGNNPSLFHGEGYDFSELREYQVGDDIRKIDWTITAKLQKPYVKLFHEERELHIVAACMMGGSLFFGTHRIKQEVVAEVAAILGYSAIKNSDLFTGAIVSQSGEMVERATKRIFGVNRFVESIDGMKVLGQSTDYVKGPRRLFKRIKRRSVLFLIGDFLSAVDLGLLSKRHEVIAVIVRDRFEEHPKPLGQVHLVDPETGATLQTHFGEKSVDRYRAQILASDKALYHHLHKHRIRFVKIYTDEDPFGKLVRLFGGRM
ncbi:DUF58 domain-containing protein [Hydrogenimonas urashimensis]|uniref:DUF58 domain-containing protein n=1 Tax=Hydrogenimonas urashimensis TaxID=2740515 RepID=UPI001F1C246A|nr:DUF58 domain-containing protein [Hydrogenimonas urashimensis]